MYEYEGVRRIIYGDGMCFVPVCPTCGRFVKADKTVGVRGPEGEETLVDEPNATCKKDGRVQMPFEGWV